MPQKEEGVVQFFFYQGNLNLEKYQKEDLQCVHRLYSELFSVLFLTIEIVLTTVKDFVNWHSEKVRSTESRSPQYISFYTFCCVVSLSIFMSCAVLWRARKVSQNTKKWVKILKRYYTVHNKTSCKRFIIQHAKFLCPCRQILGKLFLRGVQDRSMRSGTKLVGEIQLADWWTTGNLSNQLSGVQIRCDICTHFGRYLYSTKCSWIINTITIIISDLILNLQSSFLVTTIFYKWILKWNYLTLVSLQVFCTYMNTSILVQFVLSIGTVWFHLFAPVCFTLNFLSTISERKSLNLVQSKSATTFSSTLL